MLSLPRPPLPLSAPPITTLLRWPVRLIPGALHSQGLALVLNRLLAQALAEEALWFLDGRVLQIEVTDLGLDYRLTLEEGRLAAASAGRTPHVRFAGPLQAFLVLALGEEDPDTLFFQRRLQLEGDTELGLEIKNFLYGMEAGLLPPPLEGLARRLLEKL